jgi:hypothetical protein
MSHPADGEAWQDFDKTFRDFVEDPRNLRLPLAKMASIHLET